MDGRRRIGRDALAWAALALAYFLTAKLGLHLATITRSITFVWPPSGIALVALVVLGRRAWPGILVGAFAANLATPGTGIATAAAIAVGNTAEALLGRWLLARGRFDGALARPNDVLRLVAFGAVASTVASATVGTAALGLGGDLPRASLARAWFSWWCGDALSDVIVAPFLFAWLGARPSMRESAELAVVVAALVASSFTPFGMLEPSGTGFPQPYTVFPFLIWAALRLGPRGAATLNLAASALSVIATVNGRGPFVRGSLDDNLLLLGVFLAVVSPTSLLLASVVAERRRLERERERDLEALRDAERVLLDADRRKNEFLAMLAHELRNPLTPIQLAAELLKMRPREEVAANACDILSRQTAHMARLIEDLLDVSRITRGKVELRREVVAVAALIERAVEAARPAIEARRHELHLDVAKETVLVDVDSTRLEQVLTNLLLNAAKFTPDRGKISVAVEARADEVEIAVRDNGVGIAPELLPRIFDLFAQGPRDLARSEGGLGIGLTVVKALVELHGGSVRAMSEGAGRGAELSIVLPRARRPAGVSAEAPPARARPRRVLVVEDNSDLRSSLVGLVRELGHEVRAAPDGAAALDAAAAFRPDLVLLDVGLPGMDGFEVARRLRAVPELGRVRIVAVTGYSGDDDRRRSRDAGIDEHHAKPLPPSELRAILARADAS